MGKKAVILLSGGLDSTTVLAYAKDQGFDCHAISFNYDQKQSSEINAAKHIASHFGVTDHKIIPLGIGHLGGSALTDEKISIPDYEKSNEIPVTYVPARNTIFLSIALGYAEIIAAFDIFIGASWIDYSGYPDCRPEYFHAFRTLANLATKTGVNGEKFQIQTPLIELNKKATIELGLKLDVDYSMTVSCYRANEKGEACGTCDSCHYRKKGFEELGVDDPTRYIS